MLPTRCRRRRVARFLLSGAAPGLAVADLAVTSALESVPASSFGATPHPWEQFRASCGVPADVWLILQSSRHACMLRIPLTEPVLWLGDASHSSVQLPQNSIDPAALLWIAGRPYVVRLQRPRRQSARVTCEWLTAGTKTIWGDWSVHLEGLSPGPEPMLRSPFREPQVWLDWAEQGPLAPARLSESLTIIGSAEGCGIRLAAAGVEPLHAALLHTGDSLWLVDLSGQGTRVNQRTVEFLRLDPGDTIQIGSVHGQLTLRWQADPTGHPSSIPTKLPAAPDAGSSGAGEADAAAREHRAQLEQYLREQRARLVQLEQLVQRGQATAEATAALLGRQIVVDGRQATPASPLLANFTRPAAVRRQTPQ